jgi:cell filamentation protein, protein adenylyltransferase
VDVDALRGSPVGRLVPISGIDGRTGVHYDAFAFLAHPLPNTVDLASSTWTTVAQAEASLARLDQAARHVPEPSLLRQPALRREAQSTSALEGTYAPFEEVLESEIEERSKLSVEVREILNYVVAAEEGFAWIEERDLTGNLLASLQHTLVRSTSGEFSDAGRLRDRQVFIGPKDAAIEDARFIPAPFGDQLRAGFEATIDWINAPPDTMPPVVQAALAHYQFETLHPFSDGNGRIGRLLIVLQLMQQKVLRHPILVVSPWFEARRSEYQAALLRLSQTGNWNDWVAFFVTGPPGGVRPPSSGGRYLGRRGTRRRRAHRRPDPPSASGGGPTRCDPAGGDERPAQIGPARDRHRARAERPGLLPRRPSRGASQPLRAALRGTAGDHRGALRRFLSSRVISTRRATNDPRCHSLRNDLGLSNQWRIPGSNR